ncbi:amino acid racemase [Candidatus Woesearchaeota archaeon]|nr:amino acid racemase [Candidatus Woesearchaeota archaeon]
MGPEATAQLYSNIITIFQQRYNAIYDSDFPEIVIINLPIPDVVENNQKNDIVLQMLSESVKKLEAFGVDLIAVNCNTLNEFLPLLKESVDIPFISIIEETIKEVRRENYQKIGLLATETTIAKNLYGRLLPEKIRLISPFISEQKSVTKIIMNILAGKKQDKDKELVSKIVERMKIAGAEKIILGCTELPLLIKNNSDAIDTLEVFAKAIVREVVNITVVK